MMISVNNRSIFVPLSNSCRARFAQSASDTDVTARLLDEPVYHAQAEAGAFPRTLCCEERFKNAGKHIWRHAGAGVAYLDDRVLAGCKSRSRQFPIRIETRPSALDGQC